MKYQELFKLLEKEKITIAQSEIENIEKFIEVADNFPTVCFMASPAGEIFYFNTKWYEITQASIYDSIGDRWQHFIHPLDVINLKNKLLYAIRNKIQLESEYRLLNKDKKYCWHKLVAIPQQDTTGKVLFFIGTCMDINTEIYSCSNIYDKIQKLESEKKELEDITKEQERFIYMISHDLKAPLSNIEAIVDLLKENIEKNSRSPSLITLIDSSVKLFKQMIDDLGDIKNGGEDITCFVNILNEVKLNISQEIEDTGAVINYNFLDAPCVNLSKKDLYCVMQNLITNSIKYRSLKRIPKIVLYSDKEEKYITLTVIDNGIGMDGNKKDIFHKYKRLHSHVEGRGIGLYLVKNILEKSGGKIQVNSQLDQGSTFKLFFKLKKS